jgi:hypothetical protein
MKKILETIKGNIDIKDCYVSNARVVDGTLILSLPTAINPTVWRLELGNVRASALEVRKQDNGEFLLILKTPKNDIHDIAPFDSQEKAVDALMAASHAMENAHGQINPELYANVANNTGTKHTSGKKKRIALPAIYEKPEKPTREKWASGIVAIILIVVMVSLLINFGPKTPSSVPSRADAINPTANDVMATGRNGSGTSGVAISADDFLKDR